MIVALLVFFGLQLFVAATALVRERGEDKRFAGAKLGFRS